jgi:hypothetical protein
MTRLALFVVLSAVFALQTVPAQEARGAEDPNLPGAVPAPPAAAMGQIVGQLMASGAMADSDLCAQVILPGPADSFDIRFGVFNVLDDRLNVLILDSFRALGGLSLLHESVFNTAPPASGTLTVEYPLDGGRGPVVLSFTNFGLFDSAAFNTDPDTYDDPDFGATVEDLDQTIIELIYSSDRPGSRRCQGTLTFDAALNASVANIVQVFP